MRDAPGGPHCGLPTMRSNPSPSNRECPSCGGRHHHVVFEHLGFPILHCESCEHRFTPVADGERHVAEVYSDSYFTNGGAGYIDYLAERELLTASGRHYGKILARYVPPGRVLDVGSAAGFVLKGMAEVGWQGSGIEPNPRMAAYARERLGVEVEVGTLEHAVVREPVDVVTMVEVVGHFFDLRRALETAAAATRPGGVWLIEAWDYGSLTARLFGRRWHEYSPPSVVHWFTRESLARTVGRFGFREIGHGRPRKRIAVSHAKSLLANEAPLLAKLIPSVELSLPYPGRDVFYGVYRKGNRT
jgi:SAM-dependent methyltransferase